MKEVTKPNVKQMAKGKKFNAKQMSAKAGELLPQHLASIESVLVGIEGEFIIKIDGTDNNLKQGDTFIVPAEIKHQIEAVTDFKAIHIMTNDIEFEFFK